jgi:hypothetical protein
MRRVEHAIRTEEKEERRTMTRTGRLLGIALPALTLIGLVSLAPSESRAITYGKQDCTDPDTNTGCMFRNTVSLSGFRLPQPPDNTTDEYVSLTRCSGSLLSNDPYRMVILTAGHCACAYLDGLQAIRSSLSVFCSMR